MKKKSQSSIEFVLLLSFMLFIGLGFFLILQGQIIDVSEKNDQQYLSEINSIVMDEVKLAKSSMKDFHHLFSLPTNVMGQPYEIEIQDNKELILKQRDKTQLNFLSEEVIGVLYLGENIIYNLDGNVTVGGKIIHYDKNYSGIFLNVNPEKCYSYDNYSMCELLNNITPDYKDLCDDLFGLCDD